MLKALTTALQSYDVLLTELDTGISTVQQSAVTRNVETEPAYWMLTVFI